MLASSTIELIGGVQKIVEGGPNPVAALVYNETGNDEVWVGDAAIDGTNTGIPIAAGGRLSADLHNEEDDLYAIGSAGDKVRVLISTYVLGAD